MRSVRWKWWPESIKKEALKYKKRNDFRKHAGGAVNAAVQLGIMDEVCSHMEPVKSRSKGELIELLKQYKGGTVKDFRTEQKAISQWAYKNGHSYLLSKYLTHTSKAKGHWVSSKDRCKKEASKYKTRTEFFKACGSAYNACKNNGWLDEACSHMEHCAHGYFHCLYVILNKRKKLAYVGVTRDLFKKRKKGHKNKANRTNSRKIANLKDTKFIQLSDHIYEGDQIAAAEEKTAKKKGHKSKANRTNSRKIANLKDTKFIQLSDHIYEGDQIAAAEEKTAKKYSAKGFKILNSPANYGATNKGRRKYTDKMIESEAKKYNRPVEFKRGNPKIYNAACSRGILPKVTRHMDRSRTPWNKGKKEI